MKVKVTAIDEDCLRFEDGTLLYSTHQQDCCEDHYLSFADLTIEDFEGLEFDLSNDNFFNRIDNYGIELVPVKGFSIKVPGYGSNNGYYSEELTLELSKDGKVIKTYDVSECQVIEG